jgi:hypothetical protein
MLKLYPPLLDFDEYYGSAHHRTLPSASLDDWLCNVRWIESRSTPLSL